MLPLQGAQVRSLVRELRSLIPRGVAPNRPKTIKTKYEDRSGYCSVQPSKSVPFHSEKKVVFTVASRAAGSVTPSLWALPHELPLVPCTQATRVAWLFLEDAKYKRLCLDCSSQG